MIDYKIDYEKGIVNHGNLYRMNQLMQRAQNGEKLVIGFIGGSITQGCLSSTPETCYAYRVFSWWKKQFPQAEFEYINAGIGGTTSQFGVARADSDLLCYKPDFVIVEFSVNDDSTEHFMETYEGLIRRIYTSETKPALLLVNNVRYDNGCSAQLVHERIGRYYDLPEVSMQNTIYPEVLAGRIPNRDITQDDLHPNDEGHKLVAAVITYFLDKIADDSNSKQNADETEVPADSKNEANTIQANQEMEEDENWKQPLTWNDYENSMRYDNRNCHPVLKGFTADLTPQSHITDCFRNGWCGFKEGDSISFEIKGSSIAVQYRKTIHKPAPIAFVIIDGVEENATILDANFEETWGDKLELVTVAEHIENKNHIVEIRIIQTPSIDCSSFDLVAVLGSSSHKDCTVSEELLFLDPVVTHNIWGGAKLRTESGYCEPGNDMGECWGISAHPNGDVIIRNGRYAGMHLSDLWKKHPELFGNPTENRFPLLTKIIDAKSDLSIQVHPDDSYASVNEHGSLGKTECWYILDCEEGSTIIIGHNAKSREELRDMIQNGRWTEFIREIPIHKGDFIQIDPGTVHAIKGGTLILETQQNSDITYRVYDYDRLSNGKPRELHIDKSIDVITVPAKSAEDSICSAKKLPANKMNQLYQCSYYTIYKLDVTKPTAIPVNASFLLSSVIAGQGSVNGHLVRKGEHFIIPCDCHELNLEGNMELILSTK